jgi:hypothetical protein
MKIKLLYILILFLISCIKISSKYETNLGYLVLFEKLQLADEPYMLSTFITNEKGAADLDGIGGDASFVYTTAIQYYEDKIYMVDNTRRIYPKVKTLDLNTKELVTISALATENKSVVDMAFTSDGFFFLTLNKIFYYSNKDELKTGTPTKTIEITSSVQNYFINLLSIKVNTLQKYIYLLDQCYVYRVSYSTFVTPTVVTPFYTKTGCVVNSGNNNTLNTFTIDENSTLYLNDGNSIIKQPLSGSSSVLYTNNPINSFPKIPMHLYNSDLFFMGNGTLPFWISSGFNYPRNRLFKTNILNPKVKLLAGGLSSQIADMESRDSFGTFAGLSRIIYMTNDSSGNIYFIDNKSDYKLNNEIVIQRIRKASKM